MQRRARESMMGLFQLRDELKNPIKARLRHAEAPFSESMISVMHLTKDQEEKLVSTRRSFLRQCERLRKQRETSTLDIKRVRCSHSLKLANDQSGLCDRFQGSKSQASASIE